MFKKRKKFLKRYAIVSRKGAVILFFQYGTREIDYLKSRDEVLGSAIDRIGHIERVVDTDLFSCIIHHIIGQQISSAAQRTIRERMGRQLGEITKDAVCNLSIDEIQARIQPVLYRCEPLFVVDLGGSHRRNERLRAKKREKTR
ncbi:MAG: hypothetical protein LBB83_06495 [Treponema sp.]|jgi:DNA-3-methyladenine glycosylase II|nr:hypothetical protein [Treponema sp.]